MTTKITHTIKNYINPNIEIGDTVRVWDGSTFSIKNTTKHTKSLHIVYAYPELTGSNKPIKELVAIVVKTNVKNKGIVFSTGASWLIYRQDIVLLIGKTKFRCASKFVNKVKEITII